MKLIEVYSKRCQIHAYYLAILYLFNNRTCLNLAKSEIELYTPYNFLKFNLFPNVLLIFHAPIIYEFTCSLYFGLFAR